MVSDIEGNEIADRLAGEEANIPMQQYLAEANFKETTIPGGQDQREILNILRALYRANTQISF